MLCEMCGKEVPRLVKCDIEGTMLNCCQDCAKFGNRITPSHSGDSPGYQAAQPKGHVEKALERRKQRQTPRDIYEKMGPRELVDDYGERVRKARVSRGMTPEDLGRAINERKSIINQVESYTMHPDEKLVKKLERELNISLMEEGDYSAPKSSGNASKGMTLGDLIKYEDSKKG